MYEPLYRHRPSHRWTNGDLAAQVGADLGLPPDDEQRWLLDAIYAEKAPDVPASFEVVAIAPRQNIKTSTFGIAALADLFVFGVERHLWSAHLGDTCAKTFVDFKTWIQRNPDYDEQVQLYEGHQDMSIRHIETGAVLDFASRTGKGGRGVTGVKRVTLDEALYLEPKHIGAVYPTMLTKPGAQVRIGSSAGLLMSEQLRKIRDRGRAGRDGRMAYVEYGGERRECERDNCAHVVGTEGCAVDDRELWWQANCALWPGRVTEESLEDMRRSMPPEEFMREFLSWWEDPTDGRAAFGPNMWESCAVAESSIVAQLTFAVAVSFDRKHYCIAAAGQSPAGRIHVELTHSTGSDRTYRPKPVVLECKRLQDEHGGRFVVNGHGPAKVLIEPLRDAGVDVLVAASDDEFLAHDLIYDRVQQRELAHLNDADLNRSVAGILPRVVGNRTTWDLKCGPDSSPIEAVTLASWPVEKPSAIPLIEYR